MRENAAPPEEASKNARPLESLVVPVPEVLSCCFVCHHQERIFRQNAAFDSARVEAIAFRPDNDSMKRFGFVVVGPKWHYRERRGLRPATTMELKYAI